MLQNYVEILNSPSIDTWPADLISLNAWVTDFLCQPHPSLKRSGAVCPYVLPALEQKRLLLAHLNVELSPDVDKKQYIVQELINISQEFKQSTSSEEFSLDCLIVTLSGIALHERRYLIDQAQEDAKPNVVRQKLMIGGFYPYSNKYSRRNNQFFPMRSPIPIFAFRHLVKMDRPILEYKDLYISFYKQFYSES